MRHASRIRIVLALMLAVALGAAALMSTGGPMTTAQEAGGDATPQAELPTVPPEMENLNGNWPTAQGNYAGTRAAVDSTISSDNIDQLEVAWRFPIEASGFFGGFTATPIVIDDVVYIQDMQSNIFALDRATGEVLWEAEYNVGTIGPNGVAVAYGMVYAGLGDAGEVVAVDASDGTEVWRVQIGSPPGEGIDMAPIVHDGLVYISTVPGTGLGSFYAGGDRGVLYALDALTGETAWWWDTTGDDNAWNAARVAGGGGLWYPPSVDEEGNIFFGVGNPAPWPLTPECPNGECRPGDNLYTSAMVSLDAETGGLRWYYQDRPHDLLDLDFQNTPVLTTVEIDGTETKIAIGSGKTGNVVAVNDENGEVLWRTPVGKHQNDDLDELPMDEFVEIYPGTLGGVETPLAYANGTVYVTYVDWPQYQSAIGQSPDMGGDFGTAVGGIVALDVTDGTVKWETAIPTMPLAGATLANDVVFSAGLNGIVQAFDTQNGAEIWTYQAEAGINAPLAVAGDMLFVGAGSFLFPSVSEETAAEGGEATPVAAEAADAPAEGPAATPEVVEEDGEPAAPVLELIAFRIGGGEETVEDDAGADARATAEAETAAAEEELAEGAAIEGPHIDMADIFFDPAEITIPADTEVVLSFTNVGVAVHDFTQDDFGLKIVLSPGESGELAVDLPAGEYEFYCSVPGHRQAGMVGTLIVE